MSGDTLVDAHDKGTLIGNVVITKFFSDCIWIKIHLGHMSNRGARLRCAQPQASATIPPGGTKRVREERCKQPAVKSMVSCRPSAFALLGVLYPVGFELCAF